jgi:hypothetical protein
MAKILAEASSSQAPYHSHHRQAAVLDHSAARRFKIEPAHAGLQFCIKKAKLDIFGGMNYQYH